VHIFDESYISYINKGKGWMKVGGGIKVNPKRHHMLTPLI
jgi:hypothetical protein